ncbi:hypothetical protein C0J52_04592 [Blattella germanica]|nr:hypothetical protein C0J52_04592 [Blattella germanica]
MTSTYYVLLDVYDSGRRDKPSVLVTSPGSPDLHIPSRSARPPRLGSSPTNSNVGGRLQRNNLFDFHYNNIDGILEKDHITKGNSYLFPLRLNKKYKLQSE